MVTFHPTPLWKHSHLSEIGPLFYETRARDGKTIEVDGFAGDEEGIWVKGVVVQIRFTGWLRMRHVDWSSEDANGTTTHWAVRRDVRPAEY